MYWEGADESEKILAGPTLPVVIQVAQEDCQVNVGIHGAQLVISRALSFYSQTGEFLQRLEV